jgi:hypothetical protein
LAAGGRCAGLALSKVRGSSDSSDSQIRAFRRRLQAGALPAGPRDLNGVPERREMADWVGKSFCCNTFERLPLALLDRFGE